MSDIIEKVANKMIHIENDSFCEECSISIIDINKWEWAQGVGIYGLYKYWCYTKKDWCIDFLLKWFEERMKEGLPEKNVNTCAPMLTLTFVYEYTKNGKFLDIIKEWAYWVMNDMPRTKDGGLQHITTGIENKGQLWIDTLMMTNLFLARAGKILGIKEYVEESKRQFLIHIKYLFDKQSGLFFHGWSFERNDNFSATNWGRGNCWYTVCVGEYIDMIETEPFFKQFLIDTLVSQVEALKKYQCESGMWRTVINDETSYEESSATAGFAYGILHAVRMGYIDEKYREVAEKAIKAIHDCIDEDGVLQKVSYGTPVFENAGDYKKIELCPMTYGQALAMLCLTEELTDNQHNQ